VRILFIGDDAAPPLNSCEITVRRCGRTLKRRDTRRDHVTSLPEEDGHVQTMR